MAARPDIVFAAGFHPAVHAGLAQARAQGARTVYTVRAWGYRHPSWYQNADRVLMNSSFAVRFYAATTGLRSDWLPSPMLWSEIEAPVKTRGFVTFVNPAPHKGLALFARLADMLGRRRPDIPMLIVQSGGDASLLAGHPRAQPGRPSANPGQPARRRAARHLGPDPPATGAIGIRRAVWPRGGGGDDQRHPAPSLATAAACRETVAEGGIVLKLPDWVRPEGDARAERGRGRTVVPRRDTPMGR